MIQVTIDGKGYEYPENCSYYEIAKDFEKTMDAPIVLVKVDGRLRELHKQLKKNCELEFVTTKDEIGHKTYQRSLSLLLVKAVYHVGGYDKIRHVMLHFSAGSGFFYTVDGDITLNQAFLDEVKAYMHEQVEKAVPIYKRSVDTHEARERFRLHGMTDKDRLFRYRRVSRVNLYSLGDFEDYYYGFMTYDTSYLKYFDLYLYDDGFVLQMPEKKAPETVPAANLSPKVFQVQRESERWGEQMGISTVADLNERITKGNIQQMMLIAEALQEQKIAKIAEQIAERKQVKFVLIAGPSSSGGRAPPPGKATTLSRFRRGRGASGQGRSGPSSSGGDGRRGMALRPGGLLTPYSARMSSREKPPSSAPAIRDLTSASSSPRFSFLSSRSLMVIPL